METAPYRCRRQLERFRRWERQSAGQCRRDCCCPAPSIGWDPFEIVLVSGYRAVLVLVLVMTTISRQEGVANN